MLKLTVIVTVILSASLIVILILSLIHIEFDIRIPHCNCLFIYVRHSQHVILLFLLQIIEESVSKTYKS